ncbi:N-acyl-phosphatidylethanolamine-hydrolyzing phospholipase D [Pluteus cervinus]|uniref:N-acyl-phosphatidylethanolamine-hydrolyzing phospholipase D n=1 Tax=Pluteus cervinus TaxID=181527 RepID=A0ACD3ABA3_9AGAR|nr:N-acyl-phosphatidylethanolamine-hydrolyzing phospholipase D [Pluteus cervinus]
MTSFKPFPSLDFVKSIMANPSSSSILVSAQAPVLGFTGKPEHWVDDKGSSFQNPWPSWRAHTFRDMVSLLPESMKFPAPSKDSVEKLFPIRKPTWGADSVSTTNFKDKIISTWLGHACFLVEMPKRSDAASRGVRILFDPVFSDRCSPSQLVGPKRFTQPPCKIEEIPEVDVIVISHNHYDHMDTHTLQTLFKRQRKPHIFAPLGNGPYLRSLSIPNENMHLLDWWNRSRVEEYTLSVDITCTPAQHFTGRGLFDRFKTLWASWVVEEVPTNDTPGDIVPRKVYFAGDTGYRAVLEGKKEEELPFCPAFKEIGEKFGGFDFAMIPIGAYSPRHFMSPIHCCPSDSVNLFKDVRAKKALGMHWGTWVLTGEDVVEPPKFTKEECEKQGVDPENFGVCEIGETVLF